MLGEVLASRSKSASLLAASLAVLLVSSAFNIVPTVVAVRIAPKINCLGTTGTCYLSPVADAYVVSKYPTTNYGASGVLSVQSTSNRTTPLIPEQVSYLKFNLTGIPASDSVTSATLFLYLISKTTGTTSSVGIHPVSDSSWGEYTINWSNAPVRSSTPVSVNTALAVTNKNYSWDVTNTFRQVSPLGIVTFSAVSELPTDQAGFDSRETTHPPVLVIKYAPTTDTAPPSVSAIALLPSVPSSEDLVQVHANATDDTSVSSVTLTYSVNSAPAITVAMVLISNETYSGTIDRESSGSVVNYFVTATDSLGWPTKSPTLNYTVQRPPYYTSLLGNYTILQQEYSKLQAQFLNVSAVLRTTEATASMVNSVLANIANLQQNYDSLQSAYLVLNSSYDSASSRLANMSQDLSGLSAQFSRVSQALLSANQALNLLIGYSVVATIALAGALAFLLLQRTRYRRAEDGK